MKAGDPGSCAGGTADYKRNSSVKTVRSRQHALVRLNERRLQTDMMGSSVLDTSLPAASSGLQFPRLSFFRAVPKLPSW